MTSNDTMNSQSTGAFGKTTVNSLISRSSISEQSSSSTISRKTRSTNLNGGRIFGSDNFVLPDLGRKKSQPSVENHDTKTKTKNGNGAKEESISKNIQSTSKASRLPAQKSANPSQSKSFSSRKNTSKGSKVVVNDVSVSQESETTEPNKKVNIEHRRHNPARQATKNPNWRFEPDMEPTQRRKRPSLQLPTPERNTKKRRKTFDSKTTSTKSGLSLGTILQSWGQITAIHKELSSQPVPFASRLVTQQEAPVRHPATVAIGDPSGGVLATLEDNEVNSTPLISSQKRKITLDQNIRNEGKITTRGTEKIDKIDSTSSKVVEANKSAQKITKEFQSAMHNKANTIKEKSIDSNIVDNGKKKTSVKKNFASLHSSPKPNRSFLQPKSPAIRNKAGTFVKPAGRRPEGYSWNPYTGLWVLIKNKTEADANVEVSELTGNSSNTTTNVQDKAVPAVQSVEITRFTPPKISAQDENGNFTRPRGRSPLGSTWNPKLGIWELTNSKNGALNLSPHHSDSNDKSGVDLSRSLDTSDTKRQVRKVTLKKYRSDGDDSGMERRHERDHSLGSNGSSIANRHPKSDSKKRSTTRSVDDQSIGSFPKPRGRVPFGCSWDAKTGQWVSVKKRSVSLVQNDSTKERKRTASAITSMKYDGSQEGGRKKNVKSNYKKVRDNKTLSRTVSGTFPRPPGRTPLGCTWDSTKGKWAYSAAKRTMSSSLRKQSRKNGSNSKVGNGNDNGTNEDAFVHAIEQSAPYIPKFVACGNCNGCNVDTDCGNCFSCVIRPDYMKEIESKTLVGHSSSLAISFRPICALRVCLKPITNTEVLDNDLHVMSHLETQESGNYNSMANSNFSDSAVAQQQQQEKVSRELQDVSMKLFTEGYDIVSRNNHTTTAGTTSSSLFHFHTEDTKAKNGGEVLDTSNIPEIKDSNKVNGNVVETIPIHTNEADILDEFFANW